MHVCLRQTRSTKRVLEHKSEIKEATKVREKEREMVELDNSPLATSYLCLPVEEAAPRASFDGQITHASNGN